MRYELRELEKKDMPTINRWRNDPELIACLGAPFRYINLAVDETWFDNYMANRATQARCAIIDRDGDGVIGLVSLVSVDHLNQTAQLHIMIGPSQSRGQGAGTYAVRKMLCHAFDNLNLQRVELDVLANNARAIRLYEKCGFRCEGRRRSAVYKNGAFVDLLLYGILKDEFIPERT